MEAAIPYSVRRSERARHARIVVDSGGVEVVVPKRMGLRHVRPFVEEKRPWIERTLRRLAEADAVTGAGRLEDGGAVPYLGHRLSLEVRAEPSRSRAHVTRRGQTLTVKVSQAREDAVRDALERWYRRRARVEVSRRLELACARQGQTPGPLSIRAQRTRWASCSPSGAMSFNWRLLLAPAEVLDYVVEHEVAHLEVPDHSERFWRLLAQRSPGYRRQERWLRDYGSALRL